MSCTTSPGLASGRAGSCRGSLSRSWRSGTKGASGPVTSRSRPCGSEHFHMDAFGFRFPCRGRTVAFTGDTGDGPQLDRLLAGADLVIAEYTHTAGPECEGHLGTAAITRLVERARRSGTTVLATHSRGRAAPNRGADRGARRRDLPRVGFESRRSQVPPLGSPRAESPRAVVCWVAAHSGESACRGALAKLSALRCRDRRVTCGRLCRRSSRTREAWRRHPRT